MFKYKECQDKTQEQFLVNTMQKPSMQSLQVQIQGERILNNITHSKQIKNFTANVDRICKSVPLDIGLLNPHNFIKTLQVFNWLAFTMSKDS